MEKKITKIEIKNYRAFYNDINSEPYKIEIPNGENLLIYGENGSGKSSLYSALFDFFASSNDENYSYNENSFAVTLPDTDKYIEITYTDFDKENKSKLDFLPYKFGKQSKTTNESFIRDTFNSIAFLSYRDILETHFSAKDKNNNPELFNLLVLNLLKNYKSDFINGSTLNDWYYSINDLLDVSRLYEGRAEQADNLIENFNKAILDCLSQLKEKTNEYLKIFNTHLEIDIPENPSLLQRDHVEIWGELNLKINFLSQKDLKGYQFFLNEARLSSLAISLYLAGIKSSPTSLDYKILFLDDIFIGLDMSNRMPLLDILSNDFADFQIVITTYDRYWFNVAKDWFDVHQKEKWKCYEMYVNENERFDVPVVYETESNLASANRYFKDAYRPDYPATANFLRKATEEILKKFLPPKLIKNETGEVKKIMLNELIEITITFIAKLNKNTFLLSDLQRYVKILMNPLSHYETDTQIYKQEIRDTMEIIAKLSKYFSELKYKEILPRKSKIKLTLQTEDKENCYFEFEIVDDLYLLENNFSNVKIEKVEMWADFDTSKKTLDKKYISIKNFYDKTISYYKTNNKLKFITPSDYMEFVEYTMNETEYFSIKNFLME